MLTVDGALAIVDVRSGPRSRTPLSLKVRQLGKDGDTLWIRDDEARVWVMEEANGALRPLVAPPVAEAVWRPAASGRLWLADSTRTGDELGGAWDSRTGEALLSSTGVNTLAVTRDGATLLYGSAMGVVAQDLGGDERWSNTQGAVQFVGLAPGDDVAWIVSFDGSVRLADMATGRELATFVGPGTLPTAVAATAHADLLAIGGANGRVATYLRPPERPRSGFAGDLPMLQGLALSSDGLLLATGDYGGVVSLFDVPTGRLIRRWPAHSEGVRQLAFSPDGAMVAAAMRSDGVSVYDLATGEEIRIPLPQRTVSMAWLGDGPRTVDIDGQLWKIDLAGRVAVPIARGLRAASWSLAPLGADRLITAAHHGQDTGLVVLDGRNGKILQRMPLDEEGYHVAASPDLRRVAVGTQSGWVRVYDLGSGEPVFQVHADAGPTMGVAFSPDGRLLASTGYSRQVQIWDAETGVLLRATAAHDGPGLTLVFAPDGSAIFSGGGEGYKVLSLEAHSRHARSVALLQGDPQSRAKGLAELGWWVRVEEALGAGTGDGRLLAQARLALGEPAPPVPPGDLYQALLAGAARP